MLETTPTQAPIFTLKQQGIKPLPPKIFFVLKHLVALALVFILSMFLSGIILGITPTLDVYNILAFLFIGYFSAKFYQLSIKQNYLFLIATVILSLTVPTTPGIFVIILILPTLRLFKLI